jgi:hypothetical protein
LPNADLPIPVGRALRLIEAHPSVVSVSAALVDGGPEAVALITIRTELPNDWRAAGESPSGVRPLEQVTLRFGAGYPVLPPKIWLRGNFNRSHPHIQPGDASDAPEPCLFAGSPRELLRLRGIIGLVDQLVEWLERAAFLRLIDPAQGWEPVRRDHVDDVIIADAAWLRGLASADAGCAAFTFRYLASVEADGSASYWATLRKSDPIAIGPDLTREFKFTEHDGGRVGGGIGLVAWSGKKADGRPYVADRYMPETVFSVDELLTRADALGCREYLQPKLSLLQLRFRESKMKVPVPLAVVMLARRPHPVIGTDSVLELCPYIVELVGGDDLSKGSAKTVRPAMHREDISTSLLRRASGDLTTGLVPPWTLIGCGSVGSKIAMHMARAGRGPAAIADSAWIFPHNFARHATYPEDSTSKYGLLSSKTGIVADALKLLAQPPAKHTVDVVSHLQTNGKLAPLAGPETFAVVNATGSATVRETMSTVPDGGRPRTIEACLLGLGRVGIMSVEGPSANPSATDLICECYREIHQRPGIASDVFGTAVADVPVGQGCSASTMPLPDSRISMFSAAFAERFMRLQTDGLPGDGGLLLVGHLRKDGLGQDWIETPVAPRIIVRQGDHGDIRISPAVDATIRTEIARKRRSETGGIIYGRYCDVTGSFHVVGTLPAPPDSKFSRDEFVLGTKGLKPMLATLIEGTAGALYPLGTWHNHLITSGPSGKDMRTGILLSGLQYFPLLLLIHTPGGYSSMAVETVRSLRVQQRR